MLDLVIRNGLVVDGTGAAPMRADVAVQGGRIVEVGPAIAGDAAQVIDATDRVVTPGFVDVHTHFDGQATCGDDGSRSSSQERDTRRRHRHGPSRGGSDRSRCVRFQHVAYRGPLVARRHARSWHVRRSGRVARYWAVAHAGGKVFEVAPSGIIHLDDETTTNTELDWFEALAAATGINVSFICLQTHNAPRQWEGQLSRAADARRRGLPVFPLVAGRPFGVLYGWDNRNPFRFRPSHLDIEHLPLDERLVELQRHARGPQCHRPRAPTTTRATLRARPSRGRSTSVTRCRRPRRHDRCGHNHPPTRRRHRRPTGPTLAPVLNPTLVSR